MTITDLPRPAVTEPTPESQDLANLRAMLKHPDYAGFRAEIEEAIRRLTATTVLGA